MIRLSLPTSDEPPLSPAAPPREPEAGFGARQIPEWVRQDLPDLWLTERGEDTRPGAEPCAALNYLCDPAFRSPTDRRVLNNCADLRVQSLGCDVALVAEARGHRPDRTVASLLPSRAPLGTRPGRALGIVVQEGESGAPSNPEAIARFLAAGEALGVPTRLLEPTDLDALDGLGGLFLRTATLLDRPVFDLVLHAEALGLGLFDQPESMLRCCNKLVQTELFVRHGLPVPATLGVHPGNVHAAAAALGYPLVLKRVDGYAGLGVVKVERPEDLDAALAPLLDHHRVAVAQRWTPTAFDWRIGVLAGRPLFSARYWMIAGYWKIGTWDGDRVDAEGTAEAVPLHQTPRAVVEAAVAAANAVGDGFFGVDVKEVDGRPLVIEVNDTPNVWRGEEDTLSGDLIYEAIIAELASRRCLA